MINRSHKLNSNPTLQGVILVSAAIVCFAVGIQLGGTVLQMMSRIPAAVAVKVHPEIASAGKDISTDIYQIKVGPVVYETRVDPAFQTAPGDEVLIANLTIANNLPTPQHFFPSTGSFVRNRDGDTFALHPSMYLKNPFPGGDIAPGKSVKGQLSFEVPKNATNLRLFLDLNWRRMAPVVVAIPAK